MLLYYSIMTEDNSRIIQIRISIADSDALNKLIEDKKYLSVSDAVRVAIRDLLGRKK